MANDRRLRISRMMDEVLGESYDDILHEERQREALQKEPTKVERLSKMLLGEDYEGPVTEKEKEVLQMINRGKRIGKKSAAAFLAISIVLTMAGCRKP